MKVQIRDRAAMASLKIVNLRAYLNSNGWSNEGVWGERPIDVFAKERDGRTWEILIPHRDTIGGYAENMAESVAVLATVEERSQLDVYHDLQGAGADIIRVRALNGAAQEMLSLRQSAIMLNDTYGMVASAARAAEKTQSAYRGPMSSNVMEYLDNVRPLPGYHEGYAITLHSPVPAGFGTQTDLGDDFLPPFPRRATVKLAAALRHSEVAVSQAIAADALDPFLEVVPNGVSANLCGSIAELAKNGGGVEIGLTWANVRPADTPATPFQFSESSAEVLAEAAKFFRRNEPSFDEQVIAHVVHLDREPHEFDGRAVLLATRDERLTRIRVEFDHSVYGTVIRAFDEHRSISLNGDVHREGNSYELRSPRNLSLVSEESA